MSARDDAIAAAAAAYGEGGYGHAYRMGKAIAAYEATLAAGGYMVVPVGSKCPFDAVDHGGLAAEDPCPVCGDLGTFAPYGEDPPSRCISGRRHLSAPPAGEAK